MKRYILFLISMLCISLSGWSQVVFEGTVTDNEGAAAQGVIVKANNQKRILAYTQTDAKGHYTLRLKNTPTDDVCLIFSHLSFNTDTVMADRQGGRIDHQMALRDTKLREVVVKAPTIRMHGDTLTYNVKKLTAETDRNIENVIARIPGMTVNNGTIKYNGEDISAVYIDGLNMTGGNYGVATKNIAPKDVTSIDVMERHQPVKALEGKEASKSAALNLKLDAKAKIRPVGHGRLGVGGSSEQVGLSAELFTMKITKGKQWMGVSKFNNLGRNYIGEGSIGGAGGIASSYGAGDVFKSNDIGDERYYRGKTSKTDVYNIIQLSPTITLTPSIGYTYNVRESHQENLTQYGKLEGDDPLQITEEIRGRMRGHYVSGGLKIENNSPKLFLEDEFKAEAGFDNNTFAINKGGTALSAGRQDIKQMYDAQYYNISNNLRFILSGKKNVFRLNSQTSFSHQPEATLSATTTAAMLTEPLLKQRLSEQQFVTQNSTSYQWGLGRGWNLGTGVGVKIAHHVFKAQTPIQPEGKVTQTDLSALVSPTLSYSGHYGGAELSLHGRFAWMNFDTKEQSHNYFRPFYTPKLYLWLKLSKYSDLSFSGNYDRQYSTIRDFISFPLWTTYLSSSVPGTCTMSKTSNMSGVLAYKYSRPLKGFNLHTSLSAGRTELDFIDDFNVSGESLTTDKMAYRHHNSNYNWSLNVAKNFFERFTMLRLTLQHNVTKTPFVRDGKKSDLTFCTHGAKLSGDTRFFNDLVYLSLSVAWQQSASFGKGIETRRLNLYQSLGSLTVVPRPRMEFFVKPSYNITEMEPHKYRHDIFVDAGARYHWAKWEVELSASNLTNRQVKVYHTFSSIDSFVSTYYLRPIEALVTLKRSF